jgi:hypothetical protein
MGHSSARAALIYQHATQERDEAIAAGMGKLLRRARRKAGIWASGQAVTVTDRFRPLAIASCGHTWSGAPAA